MSERLLKSESSSQDSPLSVTLPQSYPFRDYVPFGYLDNPWHSAIANRSGVIRSVPPLGFGYWCRRLPWPYGEGPKRPVNYLSLVHPSIWIGKTRFHSSEDFERNRVKLVSRYHTKNLTTFDFHSSGVSVRLQWFLAEEHALCCRLVLENSTDQPRSVVFHATNIYGFPEQNWWGLNGIVANPTKDGHNLISKIWAYGDHFALGATRSPAATKATADPTEWGQWIEKNDLESNEGAAVATPNATYATASYEFELSPDSEESMVLVLARGTNERAALTTLARVQQNWRQTLDRLLDEDASFYGQAPTLEGDWPAKWKEGWVYDLETLRMTIRPPVGNFNRRWDGMQIHTPRVVLGETMLDCLALSYAEPELAKEVILGTFEDAPAPNVPCCREDGSVNMVGMSGKECGTAPIWGLPFLTAEAIFDRTGDMDWMRQLFPHLEAFVEWWLENRTDEDGWFFCDNSWESGQDGSKRFLIPITNEGSEGAEAKNVRTVDVEAAMASAMRRLARIATLLGHEEKAEAWKRRADQKCRDTQAMFVDGWFRDFDGRTGLPIILDDYWDVMMLLPVALGIASDEQVEVVRHQFQRFFDNPKHWLEWPSFMFPFCEAGFRSGLRKEISNLLAQTADRVYSRTCARSIHQLPKNSFALPEEYNYRIPGIATEYWPIEPNGVMFNGCEGYGWGATLPTLVIRNVVGFREDPDGNGMILTPMLPSRLMRPKRVYTVTNLKFRERVFDVRMEVVDGSNLNIRIDARNDSEPLRTEDGSPFEESQIPNGGKILLRP